MIESLPCKSRDSLGIQLGEKLARKLMSVLLDNANKLTKKGFYR